MRPRWRPTWDTAPLFQIPLPGLGTTGGRKTQAQAYPDSPGTTKAQSTLMPTNKCRFLPLLVAICPAEVTFSERLRPHVHAQSTSRREKKRKKTNKLLTSTEPLLFWGGAWLDSRRFRYQELPLDGAGLHFSEAVLWHVGVDVDLVAVLSRPRILDVALDLVVADRASVPGSLY